MSQLFVLFEHAAGYVLFKVREFEETGMLLPQVKASVTDLSRFNSVVKLAGFLPFKTAMSALENINSISEGILPGDLQVFLETHLPKPKKKEKITLGVLDPKLSASVAEVIGISCEHVGAIPEIIRGIRYHFHKMVQGFTAKSSSTAQLGLSHSYSRAKVKFNVNRVDNMIIQSIALLDQLDKDINTFSMRIREWYSYHFPELVNIVPENYLYAKVAHFIKNRKELSEEKLDALEEIVMDSAKAKVILDASRSSMGMDISPIDLRNIEMFTTRVTALSDYRCQLAEYLRVKMASVAPNLASLIGDQVGARLIAHAGSLINLAKCPASTVQILGAEKALFRALKTRGNTPKYGLLFHSTFIGRAGMKNKGRISRFLANKCALASRIDCFSEHPTNIFGEKLREQVEERLKFYETGDTPRKNMDVMKEAFEESLTEAQSPKKKKKKNKKRTYEEAFNDESMENSEIINGEEVADEEVADEVADEEEEPVKKKKKKKKKSKHADDE